MAVHVNRQVEVFLPVFTTIPICLCLDTHATLLGMDEFQVPPSPYERRLRFIRQAKQRQDAHLNKEDAKLTAQEATVSALWELLYNLSTKTEAKCYDLNELYVMTGVIQRLASAHHNVSKSVDHPLEHEILGYKRDQLKDELQDETTGDAGIPAHVLKEIERDLGLA